MSRTLTKPEIEALPIADRLRLMEDIWDTLDEAGAEPPVPDWQVKILEERLDEHLRNPGAALPWHEVQAQLRDALRK